MTPEASKLLLWKRDPVIFVREVFGAEPDEWQKDVLRAFPTNNRMAMKACKGPGKTTCLAWLAWNFMATRPNPKIAATSISGDNLSDGLWAEMAKWQNKSEFLKSEFSWTKTKIFNKDHYSTWFMSARTWPKTADTSRQADTLAGLHEDYILFILDEAGGIPLSVMAAAEAALSTGVESKIIMAGNPTHKEGPLYRACTNERHLWWVIEISSAPDDPKRTPRVSIEWAQQQIDKYGKNNPWVLVNVYGQFPPSSLNVLLSPEEITAAMGRKPIGDSYKYAQKRLGIDVARFGDDRTIIFPRQGLWAYNPVEMRNARSNEIAARVALAKSKWSSEMEFIDDTGGYGSGVIDSLIMAGQSPIGIHFAAKANDERYFNKRSEMWFEMAEWIKRGGCLPNIPELAAELAAPTYTFANGKFRLEKKDQIKDRLGFSPDYADALALTFAFPEMPNIQAENDPMVKYLGGGFDDNKLKYEYDPFAE